MKIDRQKVYDKYNGHCAYLGKDISIKEQPYQFYCLNDTIYYYPLSFYVKLMLKQLEFLAIWIFIANFAPKKK